MPELLGDLQALQTRRLGHNQLAFLPERLGDLQALQTLLLHHFPLQSGLALTGRPLARSLTMVVLDATQKEVTN